MSAVAVRHVVIDDGDAGTTTRSRVSGADRNVAVETESHRAIGFRVMPERPHQHERARTFFAIEHAIDAGQDGASRQAADLVGVGRAGTRIDGREPR